MKNYKFLIVGHQRHGKDTFAEILHDHFGMSFKSSSQAASEIFIYDVLKEKYGYKTPEECFEDRINHRAEWYNLICDYNKDDRARLGREIAELTGCYVGMRDKREIDACIEQGIFDLIIWVDASERVGPESEESFNIDISIADIVIQNNRTTEEFLNKTLRLGKIIFGDKSKKALKVQDILKKVIDEDGDFDIYDLVDECVMGWPEITMGEEDEVAYPETLDLENWRIISIEDDKMVMCAGGDWQDPQMLTLVPENDQLKVINVEPGYENGLSYNEILEKILK